MPNPLRLFRGLRTADRVGGGVARRLKRFDGWLDRASGRDAGAADYDHTDTVKEYYDISSELMIFGWGESLHFAPLSPDESLVDSKVRHQRLMIEKLELREGMTVVDVGCGIGGPMRRVVSEAGVRVVGVNINEIQMEKAKGLNAEAGIDHMVDYLVCSFMDMASVEDGTFDRGYAIESTCHAPDKAGAFAEIYRVLKPGALFWGQEMCMTDRFDADDDQHQAMKQDLMHGIALKEIATFGEVNRALETAGFELIEGMDRAVEAERSDHAVVSALGAPLEDVRQRPARGSPGPQGVDRDVQARRGAGSLAEGFLGRRRDAGPDRHRLRGRRQVRHLHPPLLLPSPQTPVALSSAHRCRCSVYQCGRYARSQDRR